MRGAVMYGPGDVRVEERDKPRIVEATDTIVRLTAACACGSDLWPYRHCCILGSCVGSAYMGGQP
jgi:threonine dehydrogenase-like Zn-dependent dehydrogenase